MMEIVQYNTADVENFGDVLYPVILKKFAHECGNEVSDHYAFLGGQAPMEAGYVTKPINDLFRQPGPKKAIVIGGGDIIRLDDEVMAGHYHVSFEKPTISYARRDQWSPAQKSPLKIFQEKMMPPVRGAFLLSSENCPRADRVAYFSAGVPFEFIKSDFPLIQSAFDSAKYIYVRDSISAGKLKRAGVKNDIVAAPDFLIGISNYFDKHRLKAQAESLQLVAGHDPKNPYLCFQVSAAGLNHLNIIGPALLEFSRRHRLKILLLPLGFCHHDREVLQRFSAMSRAEFKFVDVSSIEQMLAVIAHAAMFVGISMHGNIVARSYGVPHLFGPLFGVDKIQGAMEMLRARPVHRLDCWENLSNSLNGLLGVDSEELVSSSSQAFVESVRAARAMMKSIADQ